MMPMLSLYYDPDIIRACEEEKAVARSATQVIENMVFKAHRCGDKQLVARLREAYKEAAIAEAKVGVSVAFQVSSDSAANPRTLSSTKDDPLQPVQANGTAPVVKVSLTPKLSEVEELDDSLLTRTILRLGEASMIGEGFGVY